MQTLAVLALVVGVVLFLRRLGPPRRRSPEGGSRTPKDPEADIPPPGTLIIF